jgi:hypothetical protein
MGTTPKINGKSMTRNLALRTKIPQLEYDHRKK